MVEYDSGYTAGMVYVKYLSGVRGEIQIVGEKVLDIANAEHIPYDAFLGKPYAGAFPKENLGKASEIMDPIRAAATSLDEVQKAKYPGYLNSQYTRARQIEQGASPAAVNLPEGISGKLSVDNLIKANSALNKLKAVNRTGFNPATKSGLQFEFKSTSTATGRTIDFSTTQKINIDGTVTNKSWETSFINAHLDETTGHLYIDKMGAQPGHHIGREMISNVIESVGPQNIKSIGAGFADTNLDVFRRSLDAGKSPASAARNTPFGRALRDLGFDNYLFKVEAGTYPRPSVLYKIKD